MNAHEVFEQEWRLYKSQANRWILRDAQKAPNGKRDDLWTPVEAGEYRIFADVPKPFVALVIERQGAAGYLVVPVSPFSVPASEREMLVGERVLQLWNACTAAKSLVERSWVVDAVPREDIAEIKAKVAAAMPGRLTAGDSVQAQYEKEFLVADGALRPLAPERAAAKFPMIRRAGFSLAAMLVIGLGVAWLVVSRDARVSMSTSAAKSDMKNAEIAVDSFCEQEDWHDKSWSDSAIDEVAANIPIPVELPEPVVACALPEPVEPAARDKVMVISSPVKMKTMVGSRKDSALSKAPAPVCCAPARAQRDMMYEGDVGIDVNFPDDSGYASPGAVGTERFAEYKENEFLDPRNEPLSTFGLDVDTSSYTLMRSYVMDSKRRPPRESVRLAEYVNYFKYDYAQPTGGAPLAADCELAQCPWNASNKLLRIGIQAKRLNAEAMPPCNLTFLVDCSGSMSGNNGMALLKRGLRMLVAKLRPEDHVSIVTYASGCDVRLASTPGSKKNEIIAAINSLAAYGATSGGAGLQLAYGEAQRNFDKAANNRVILVTDGDFNVGISSPRELEEFIAKKRDTGIFLSVIGVGRGNYQDAAMKRLAAAGNGNYAYVDSALEAKKVMDGEFGGTLFTVAKDVKVQVEFNPASVAEYRLLGYESRMLKAKDFNDDRKDAGEVGADRAMTALYEIVPRAGETSADAVDPLKYQKTQTLESPEMFTLKMRWKAPDAVTSEKIELAFTQEQLSKPEPSADFRFASAVAEFALILQDSKFKGNANLASVFERARAAKGDDADGYRAEFIRLVEILML